MLNKHLSLALLAGGLLLLVGCAPTPPPPAPEPTPIYVPQPAPPPAPVAPAPPVAPVAPFPFPFPIDPFRPRPEPRPDRPHWMHDDLDHALARAQVEKKPTFVLFTLKTCNPCRQMKARTLTHPQVAAWLRDEAVYLEVDAEDHRETAEHYEVKAVPTYLLLSPDGTVLRRGSGFLSAVELLRWARRK